MTGGLCECGCGQRTNLARQTRQCRGQIKGEPVRFLRGHSMRGRKHSPETRAAIRAYKASPETRAKQSAAQRGRKHSPETRAKISAANRGPLGPNWKGGRAKHVAGYIHVQISPEHPFAEMRNSFGYIFEHRLVMAEHLGRPLSPKEVVHHVNEIRDDNRLENLRLFDSGAAHASHHQELRRAA